MSYKPFISVIIPTYNRAQHTIVAIESVLAQKYSNFEIIVVDDGSTDGSGEAIQRFISQKKHRNDRVHYLSQPNQGPSVARNTGITRARGEYIAFLDSDDIWLPEKLDLQLRAIGQFRNDCGACFTDARLLNSSGMDISSFRIHGRNYQQLVGIDPEATMSLANSFSGFWVSTLLVRADLVRRIGGFDPDVRFAEDRDFHFRLSVVTSIAYVNEQLVRADRTPSPPDSACRPWDKKGMQFRGQQCMFEKWLSMDALPRDVHRAVERNLGALYSHWTNWHLENARYREARQTVRKAVKHKLTPGLTVKWVLTWLAPALARRITPKTRPIGTLGHAS